MSNVHPKLSDLFFNYEKQATYPTNTGDTSLEEYEAAIHAEAREFLEDYVDILDCPVPTPTELQQDFLGRL